LRAKATRTTSPFQQANSRPSALAQVRADRRHFAIMLAWSSPTGMAFTVLLYGLRELAAIETEAKDKEKP
jgi:hypothetical protein